MTRRSDWIIVPVVLVRAVGVVAHDLVRPQMWRCPMKAIVFGTAVLVCALPAFAQVGTTFQTVTGTVSAPAMPGNCEAALVSPGVPSAIVVLTVPTPAAHPGGFVGSAHPFATPGVAPQYPASSSHSSSTASGVIWGGGTVSGIGSMSASGVGAMRSSGIGSMERSGVGSIGSSNIGSFGPSPVLTPTPAPSPFIAPPVSRPAGSPTPRGSATGHRQPGATQALPFFCP